MRNLLLFLLFAISLSSCSTCSLKDRANNLLDSALAEVQEQMREDSLRQVHKEQLRYRIDSIIAADFTAADHIISDTYLHSSWDNTADQDRNALGCMVYTNGSIVLLSTLPEMHTDLHNKVEIEIAGTVYTSDSNYTYPLTVPNGINYTAVPDARGEALYILEEDAMDLIEAIAANPAEEIKVTARFNDEVYASYTLTEEVKHAIIASYKLSLLIKELQELEAQDVEFDD